MGTTEESFHPLPHSHLSQEESRCSNKREREIEEEQKGKERGGYLFIKKLNRMEEAIGKSESINCG